MRIFLRSIRGFAAGGVLTSVLALQAAASPTLLSIDQAKQQKWSNCAAGAAVGALIGNQIGKKLSIKGLGFGGGKKQVEAATTVVGGLVVCGIAQQLSSSNKTEIDEVEQEALKSGSAKKTVTTKDNKEITVQSTSTPVKVEGRPDLNCKQTRTTYSEIAIQRGAVQKVSCEDDDGEFVDASAVL